MVMIFIPVGSEWHCSYVGCMFQITSTVCCPVLLMRMCWQTAHQARYTAEHPILHQLQVMLTVLKKPSKKVS